MNPGVWELKGEVLCNSSQLMSSQPVLWPTREAKRLGDVEVGRTQTFSFGSKAQPYVCRMRSVRTKGCVWPRARAIFLQRLFCSPQESSSSLLLHPPASRFVVSWAHLRHGDTSQASSSSVLRNGRVGATDTHRYPAAYYFLSILAPVQGPAWQVDEFHQKAQQWASFPGMLLLTRFTYWATPTTPGWMESPSWMGRFFFFGWLLLFFLKTCLQSGSCDCFNWYKQLPT